MNYRRIDRQASAAVAAFVLYRGIVSASIDAIVVGNALSDDRDVMDDLTCRWAKLVSDYKWHRRKPSKQDVADIVRAASHHYRTEGEIREAVDEARDKAQRIVAANVTTIKLLGDDLMDGPLTEEEIEYRLSEVCDG